ncbi:sensor histidine kinase [Proteocatella sphenisci]|uniref:sensor histidine kinase n=1 Tax=Proteocatella sphenisci TaxID=181070 RepID=UPI00048EE21B|nr:ATP-binding protein [Proteocatella sphenisci]
MNKVKKMLLALIVIAVSSRLYINFYTSNFNFSFGAVLFPVFIYLDDERNPLSFGILLSFTFFLFRFIFDQEFMNVIPEMTFYMLYGLIFFIAYKIKRSYSLKAMFFLIMLSDFAGNILEMYLRIGNLVSDRYVIRGLATAAVTRAVFAAIIILSHKYYRNLLIKEEHELRYKKLLWFTSQLKTEVYWMEKNMDHIEKVMGSAYNLFIDISEKKNENNWSNRALEISTNTHEIKKEYDIVVRGIESILEHSDEDPGMNFSEIARILKETIKQSIVSSGKDISLEFISRDNFYTFNHYDLMSILRNLINNSVEAIDKKGEIKFIHKKVDGKHIFRVEDTGSGIPHEDRSFIFSPGFSSKINYSTGEINRGLGLALVKNIVKDKLGGEINFISKENEGTSFLVEIPAKNLEGGFDENIFD